MTNDLDRFYILSGTYPVELLLRVDPDVPKGYVWTEDTQDATAFDSREPAEYFRDKTRGLTFKNIANFRR